jgi:hypothetical protein
MNAGAWPNGARDEIDRVFGLESAIAHLSGARVDEDFRGQPHLGATWHIALEPDKPTRRLDPSTPASVTAND